MDNKSKLTKESQELVNVKNKNEKISRQILDKEQHILNLQSEGTLQQAEIKSLSETLELTTAKVKALEAFSSNLQQKYDKLAIRCA